MMDQRERRLFRYAVLVSVGLLAMRVQVALGTGFGDSEALYASYALFPQPAYLDHPGLIGMLARWLGGGGAPEPATTHLVTGVLATLVPWLGLAAARATGASWRGAVSVALALALVPELAIGLYALTPDLPLAITWLGALGLAAYALRAEPRSFRALWSTLLVGVLVGLACLAKVSGLLLGAALLATSLARPIRSRWRTFAPWGALGVALVLIAPLLLWELRMGLPMLRHRLIAQAGPLRALTNLAVVLGGQLAYVLPPFLVGAWLLWRDLWRRRGEDNVSRLLVWATLLPAVPLVLLCAWSAKAEPHWLAPAFLPLALHLGRSQAVGRRLAIGSLAAGGAVTLLAFAWISTELPVTLLGRHSRWDLSHDLYAWGPGRELVENAVRRAELETRRLPVVVGPHWVVCAQAQAALGHRVPVGCNSLGYDDFDRWLPRDRWLQAPVVLYVHDDRFELDAARELPDRLVTAISRVGIRRGGTLVRTIRVTRLELTRATASGQCGAGAWPCSPAVRKSSSSSLASTLGVVSSFSP